MAAEPFEISITEADDLYTEVIETFGEPATVTLVALIGQYLATSALLTCFRVPAPCS